MITTVQFADEDNLSVSATINGQVYFIPVDSRNRHWQMVLEWVQQGNTIQPYQAPVEIRDLPQSTMKELTSPELEDF